MITRRAVLSGAAAAAAAIATRPISVFAEASQPATPVNFDVPANACDCHTHIFDPARFPYSSVRTYTPEPASIAEMERLHGALRTPRVVIVQPSVYGTDNSCTVDALARLGARARGVCVIDDATPERSLDEWHTAGIRGIRLNLETGGIADPSIARRGFQHAVERIRARGWHIQMFTRLSVIASLEDLVMAAPMPLVFDHFGSAQASLGPAQPGFDALVRLVRAGRAYVKISAPYLVSTDAPAYADVGVLARALVSANAERILCATNWPHPDSAQVPGRKATDLAPLRRVDDGMILNQLARWVPDAATRQTILVTNPARLYGF